MPHRGRLLLIAFDLLTLSLMFWFILAFLSKGVIEVSETVSSIYLIILGYYVGDKEFERWRLKFHKSERRGELFVGAWALIAIVMFAVEEWGGKAQGYNVPHYLTFLVGGVTVMYVVTEVLKNEHKRRR